MDSAFILQKKLDAAERDIASLRTIVDHTIAIIVGAGGRVEVPVAQHDEWSAFSWRHENDGIRHVFTAIRPQAE